MDEEGIMELSEGAIKHIKRRVALQEVTTLVVIKLVFVTILKSVGV